MANCPFSVRIDVGPRAGYLTERHRTSGGHRNQNVAGDPLGIVPQIARIAHVDAEALAALDRRRHGLPAQRGRNHVLDVLDHDPVTRQCRPVRRHVEVVAADAALGIGRRSPRHGLEDLLDLLGELVDLGKVGADHLDPDRGPDPR
jgi:hypothetical protein